LEVCSNEPRCLSQPPRKRPTPRQYFRKETLDPYAHNEIKATSCELQTLSSERLDQSKLTQSVRTRTTLERVPRGFLAACARHSCGFLQDTLLLLPDALFACSGAFHGDTASFESRHFVSSLQHYYQTLWRHAQSIWLLRKVLQTVRHVLSELCNCLLPAKSSLSSASSAS
jgi:hypothetical protein